LTAATRDPVALARRDLERFAGDADVAALAAAMERVAALPEFATMAEAANSYRPQWAGVIDGLYERPLLVTARKTLHNALGATFRGETLYYNAFGAFVDAVIVWHHAYTGERTGERRLTTIYDTIKRLLLHGRGFIDGPVPGDPDEAFFERLKHVRLSGGRGYALIRTAGRYLAALEGATLERRVSTLRGTVTMTLAIFTAQVVAMSAAVQAGRKAIDAGDAEAGLSAYLLLLQTPPVRVRVAARGDPDNAS
jgi:hypothetical protein